MDAIFLLVEHLDILKLTQLHRRIKEESMKKHMKQTDKNSFKKKYDVDIDFDVEYDLDEKTDKKSQRNHGRRKRHDDFVRLQHLSSIMLDEYLSSYNQRRVDHVSFRFNLLI